MADLYTQLMRMPVTSTVGKKIGLPQPVELDRGSSEVGGRVLLGGAGRVAEAAARVLAELRADSATALDDPVRDLAARAGLDAAVFNPAAPADHKFKALVFDATGIVESADLVELQRFFYPTVGRLQRSGRVIVLGGGRRALEGFTRSLGKEVGPARRDREPRPRRGGRGGADRADAEVPAHAALGLRLRPGDPGGCG